jgi:hypothetical protein
VSTEPTPRDLVYSIVSFFTALFALLALGLSYLVRATERAFAFSSQQRALDIRQPKLDTDKLYRETLQEVRAAQFPSPDQFIDRFSERYAQELEDSGIALPIYPVGLPLFRLAHTLYAEERFSEVPAPTSATGAIQTARFRDRLLELHKRLDDPHKTVDLLSGAIIAAAVRFTAALPAMAAGDASSDDDNSAIQLPLLDAIPNIGAKLTSIILPFFDPRVIELDLFSTLRNQLTINQEELGGIDPHEFKGSPRELVHGYLKNTPLEPLFDSHIPFALPEETRFAGHWIISPPGRGKTTLLHAMVNADLSKDASVVLIDSKGDLIEPIRSLQSVRDRLLLIEPNPETAFALNPLDASNASIVQVVSLIEYIMAGLLDAKFTALQTTLFRNVVPAIIEAIPSPTLDDFKQVMVKGLPSLEKINPHARQFFENRETGFHSKTYESTRKEVVWRLDYLMSNPTLRSMFSATHTKLDMGKEMDAGKVIIINNSKAILGDEGAEFFGRFFVALIARAAQQRGGRPASSKKPCFVYIDECQSVIAKDARIPVLLDECRSQKIALILSHQRTAQLTAPVLDAVANCAIRMANSDDEARFLADKLRMSPDSLRSLPRGTFGTFVRDLTPSGIKLQVSKIDLDSLPRMTDADLAALRERMRNDFASSPPASDAEQLAKPLEPATDRAPPSPPAAKADPGEPASDWA